MHKVQVSYFFLIFPSRKFKFTFIKVLIASSFSLDFDFPSLVAIMPRPMISLTGFNHACVSTR